MTELEILEAPEQTDHRPKIVHAFCIVCQARALPEPALSMCGFRRSPIEKTRLRWTIPPECCVVCMDLAAKPCEKCGY